MGHFETQVSKGIFDGNFLDNLRFLYFDLQWLHIFYATVLKAIDKESDVE